MHAQLNPKVFSWLLAEGESLEKLVHLCSFVPALSGDWFTVKMRSRLSCLSSQRLKKDVVDSLQPSRRYHLVAARASPEISMVLHQSYVGGKPLPLPKPDEVVVAAPAAATQQEECYDFNISQSLQLYSSSHFENDDDDDDRLLFAKTRASSLTLCYPRTPVSSPATNSGKCSPAVVAAAAVAAGAVVCTISQEVQQQEHPSPPQNGDVPPPPLPWSTSSGSCFSLNEDSSSLSPPRSAGNDHRFSCQQPSSVLALEVEDTRKDVKVFGLEEIVRACSHNCNREHDVVGTGGDNVRCFITGWIKGEEEDGHGESERSVAVVWNSRHSRQGWNEWAAKVKLISRVEDPRICKLQGYCGLRDIDEQILVYEHVGRGSLSDYLFGSLCKALLDWRSRVRIALGAARALACLHDLAPIEVVYEDFKSSNILLDSDLSVKIAGHGLNVIAWQVHDKLNKAASAVLRKSEASNRSNIHSYGVLLLELLTGKSIASQEFGHDESLFVKWATPYLNPKAGGDDEVGIASILDPQLRRQMPCAGLKIVAALTRQCLRTAASKRPCISEVVDILDSAMGMLPPPESISQLYRRSKTFSSVSAYKCFSLRRLHPPSSSSQSLKAGFCRTFSNKHF